MKTQRNHPGIKRLLRILDTLNGFELVICGCQSKSIFNEMLELAKTTCRGKKIEVKDIDISGIAQTQDFENLLREIVGQGNGYRVCNILGLTRHVKVDRVSSFFNHINLIRERFAADYPYAFFFWLPENLLRRFTLDAPDLWAWRNTVLVFEDQERESIFDLIPIKTYIGESFENFTKKEQQSQLDHLYALKLYVKKMPESAMQKKRLSEIYNDIGKLSYSMRQYSNALSFYRFSLDLGEEVGDLNGIAAVYNNMAIAYQADGDYDRAFHYYRESLNTPVEPDDREKRASIYNNMGILLGTIGEYHLAFEHYRGSKDLFLQLGNRQGIGAAANNMGIVYELRRDFNAALEAFQESLTVFEEHPYRDELNIAVVVNNIGHVYYSQGDYDAAADCLKERGTKLSKLGFKSRSVVTLYKLTELYKEAEQEEERIKWLRRTYQLKKELGYPEKDMDWEVLANIVR